MNFCFDFPASQRSRKQSCLGTLKKTQYYKGVACGCGSSLWSHRPQCVAMQNAPTCPHGDNLLCRSLKGCLPAAAPGTSHGSNRKTCVGGHKGVRAPWAKPQTWTQLAFLRREQRRLCLEEKLQKYNVNSCTP